MKIEAKDLGLSEKEAKVYLAMLKLGQATAQEIAQEAGIKRSTCYLCLERLKGLGLVSQTIQGNKRSFLAENPYRLLSLAEKERQQAQKREEKIMEIIPTIKTLAKEARILPKFRYYERIEGIWTALDDSLKDPRDRYFIGSFESLLKVLGREEFTKNYTDKRRQVGNKAYMISDQFSQPQRAYFTEPGFRAIKYLPKNIKTSSSVWFYGNKLLLLTLSKPCSATLIESAEIVALLRFMFDLVWQKID